MHRLSLFLLLLAMSAGVHADGNDVGNGSAARGDDNGIEPVASQELARLAERIRNGEIDVGKDFSLDVEKGRFHIIHADIMMLDCSNCHYGLRYRDDYMIIGREEPFPAEARGRYQRSVCLGCHQSGGIATPWYNSSTLP